MLKILPLLFLLTDPRLLSELFHRGLECGLMILFVLGVTAGANAARRRIRGRKPGLSTAQ